MTNKMQDQLDAVLPERLILENPLKQRILHQAHQRLDAEALQKRLTLKPLMTAAAFVVVAGVLAVPYVEQGQQKHAFQEALYEEKIQKVVVPNVAYPNLINSIYVEENSEIIHTDEKGIYSYSINDKTETVLVPPSETIEFSSVSLEASENWVVWGNSEIHILNRKTGKEHVLLEDYIEVQLIGDQILYLAITDHPVYYLYDLETNLKIKLHDMNGNGISVTNVRNDRAAIVEVLEGETGSSAHVSIYNLESRKLWQTYKIPYESVSYLTLEDDRMYGQFSYNGSDFSLGYLDLNTGKVHMLDIPGNSAYAIYDDFLALSVNEGDSDTVKLFHLKEDTAEEIKTLNGVGERLVKPRFNDSGKLIVNGEGQKTPLYIIDTKKLQDN